MTYVSPTPPRAIVSAPAASRFRTRGFVWWLPLVVAAVAAAAAFALSERQEQVYESRAALLAPEGGPLTPEALVAELQREAVFTQTISALQLDTTAEALRERIDVRSEGIVIEVLARAPSPREAEALARVFVSEARDPRVTDHGALLTPYRQPLLPQRRAGGDTARNTAAAVAGGLIVGLGLALLVSGRERPGRHGIDVTQLTGWPMLASLPRSAAGGASAGTLTSPYAALQTAVEERRLTRGFRTLLVVGVEEGDGATTVAVQLALAASRGGVATTLVDADLAAPSVHRALGIEPGPGLAESLRAPAAVPGVIDPTTLPEPPLPLQRVDVAQGPAGGAPGGLPAPPLRVLSAGAPQHASGRRTASVGEGAVGEAAALYRSPRLGEVLLQLAGESSLVIVNGPPLSTEGAPALARQAEATLVVVNGLSADPELIEQTAARLEQLRDRVIGAVVTRAPGAPVAAPAPAVAPPASVGAAPRGVAPPVEGARAERPSQGPFREPPEPPDTPAPPSGNDA